MKKMRYMRLHQFVTASGSRTVWAEPATMNAHVMRILLICVATAFGFYLCYRLAFPFMSSLTAALVLSIMLLPMHRKLEGLARHANLAASISGNGGALGVSFFWMELRGQSQVAGS